MWQHLTSQYKVKGTISHHILNLFRNNTMNQISSQSKHVLGTSECILMLSISPASQIFGNTPGSTRRADKSATVFSSTLHRNRFKVIKPKPPSDPLIYHSNILVVVQYKFMHHQKTDRCRSTNRTSSHISQQNHATNGHRSPCQNAGPDLQTSPSRRRR